MLIYSSSPKPYVYVVIHRVTNEFYFGYRERNVKLGLTSLEDLPKYRTSSKKIKSSFEEYSGYVLAEFDSATEAYDFEQKLIYEYWSHALLLNDSCYYGKARFKSQGPCSEETKLKISQANRGRLIGYVRSEEFKSKIQATSKGRKHSESTKARISQIVAEEHRNKTRTWSEESKKRLSNTNKGRALSDEQKRKISEAKRKRDKEQPMSEETKRKISETLRSKSPR